MCTRTQKKREVTPQETDPDMLVSVQESPVDAWVSGGLLEGQRHAWDLLNEVTIIFITSTIVWSQVKQQGRNTTPPINRKLNWRFADHGPAHQNKTQFPSQSVSPIRKLP